MTPADTLRALMLGHNLSRTDAARLCEVDRSTVSRWLSPPTASQHQRMPRHRLTVLKANLREWEGKGRGRAHVSIVEN